ncbi:MAG: hypothetical protein LQ345_003239 [Seirophora villosa]|nr:MAG: hypothetical protein LQ345_003239 [Seirophora villosa]
MGLDEDPIELFEEIKALKQRTDSSLKSLFATWDTDEDSLYIDEIHRLVNGHSLALALLILNIVTLGPSDSCLRCSKKFQLKKSIISGDKHAEMIATLEQVEFAGLRNNRSPDLKAAYMKIGTGTSESLKEKHIQIEFLEYLAAVGLLEKFR